MNKNLQGGYYIVSLGDVELLGESVSLPNIAKLLYEAKKHKFVVLQGIVMDGEKKTAIPVFFDASMAYTTEPDDWDEETDGEFVPEPIYTATIYNVYGNNIAIDAEGGAIVSNFTADANPSSLFGKFVKIIDADDIDVTALTDDQIEAIVNGVYVNGVLLNSQNPVFFPAHRSDSVYYGTCILSSVGSTASVLFTTYVIANRALEVRSTYGITFDNSGLNLNLKASAFNIVNGNAGFRDLVASHILSIYGKNFPEYPTDQANKTYVLKLVNGTLTWVEETA